LHEYAKNPQVQQAAKVEEGRENEVLYRNLFNCEPLFLLDLALKISTKPWQLSRHLTVNADTLLKARSSSPFNQEQTQTFASIFRNVP
jgi:hypothetical protein